MAVPIPIQGAQLPTVCPACRVNQGIAVSVLAEQGVIIVSYRCPTCAHRWARSHRDPDMYFEDNEPPASP